MLLRQDPSAVEFQILKDGHVVPISGSPVTAELTSIDVSGSSGADVIDLNQLNALIASAMVRTRCRAEQATLD